MPRLTYTVTRDFSRSLSSLGFFLIFAALCGSIIATVLTKGRIASSAIVFLPNVTEPGFTCNSTAIYPGQTFGSVALNSTFTYTSLAAFAYSGEPFNNCVVQPQTFLDVIGPPVSWPRFGWNHTIHCDANGPLGATFSVTTLNHYDTIESSYAVGIWNQTIQLLRRVSTTYTCDDNPVQAFRVEEDANRILMLSETTGLLCIDSIDGHPDVAQLSQTIKDAIAYDFDGARGGPLSPLTDILYPCTSNTKLWAPVWTIIWECYTSAAATISPALLIVAWLLLYLKGDREGAAHPTEEQGTLMQSNVRWKSTLP